MIGALPPEALVLETPRLILAPFTHGDLDIAQALLCDARVMQYVTEEPMTPEAVAIRMPDAVKRGAGGRIGIWVAFRKDTGRKIGDVVLTPIPIDDDDVDWSDVVPDRYPQAEIEVGYLLTPEAWGQGLATEACARMLRFAFEQTDRPRIVAVTDPDNRASQKVLDKCGLSPLGRARAYGDDDVAWFAITREDWLARA